VRFSRLPASERKLIRVSITDIAARKRNDEFTYAQNKILEMIATNSPFEKILLAICWCTEKIANDMRAAVMKLDARNQVLHVEQAPSLPEEFRLALDFIKVDPQAPGCGAAVHANREKFVLDISKQKSWAGQHELAKKHKVKGVWSFPLHGEAGRIIGALDVYLDQTREPTTQEQREPLQRSLSERRRGRVHRLARGPHHHGKSRAGRDARLRQRGREFRIPAAAQGR
jgi:hypothetical protein